MAADAFPFLPLPDAPLPGAFALLDDGAGGAWYCHGLAAACNVDGPAAWEAALDRVAAWNDAGHTVVAALGYELGLALEPAVGVVPPSGPLARFWCFESRDHLDGTARQAWLSAWQSSNPAWIGDLQPAMAEMPYRRGVQRIRDYIAAGDCYQVNFTFPVTGRCIGHPLRLYADLCARQPVGCGGVVMHDEGAILSLSPELFLERQGARLVSRPMKGTAPRGATPAEDAAARAALAASAKDRAENVMIVDLIRNDLARVAETGSVTVERLFDVEPYPTVLQMTSTVAATQRPNAGLAEILAALFPCGSITGAPKVRAMQIVAELEGEPRGLYTGSLGWIAPGGDFRFNVAIRTVELARDGTLRLGVGSGITYGSDPAAEYRECLLKARFLTDAALAGDVAQAPRLIETLRLEVDAGGARYPRLDGHRVRLTRSAAALGFACDWLAVARALEQAGAEARREWAQAGQAGGSPAAWRVRLTLGRSGDVEIARAPLDPLPAGPLALLPADEPLDSRDGWLAHKTTVRGRYDKALAALAGTPEIFDVLYCNERGEVAEGARSTLFARIDGRLLTPPLACGVLPGVLRAELLARGAAEEAMLTPADLQRAEALYCGNALRGLVPVHLRD